MTAKTPFFELDNLELAEDYIKSIMFVLHKELCFGSEFTYPHPSEDTIEDYFETSLFSLRTAIHSAIVPEDIINESAVALPFLLRAYFETTLRYFMAKAQQADYVTPQKVPVFLDTPKLIGRIDKSSLPLNTSHLREIWGVLSNYSHCNIPFDDVKRHFEKKSITLMTTMFPYCIGDSIITKEKAMDSFPCLYFLTEMRALWFCVQRTHEYARYYNRDISKESALGKMELCSMAFNHSHQVISEKLGIVGGPFSYIGHTLIQPEAYGDEYFQGARLLSEVHLAALQSGIDVSFEEPRI
jgi:hypothetical protein